MALGRQRDRQSEMLVAWSEMPRSLGHVFYDRQQAEVVSAGLEAVHE
jgi:transposase